MEILFKAMKYSRKQCKFDHKQLIMKETGGICVFCTNCGNKLNEDDYFCPECGTKNKFINEFKHPNNQTNQESAYIRPAGHFEFAKNNNLTVSNSVKVEKPVLVKTSIIGNDSRKSASSSVIRGSVGGLILGPIGLVGGLLSGKNRNKTTFLLSYSDGSKKTLTVKTGGLLFNQLIKFMSE